MDSAVVIVGRIVRAHGLRGELVVAPATLGSDVLFVVDSVLLEQGGTRARREIVHTREQGKSIVLTLDGVPDRTAAEKLIGAQLLVERDELPEPDEGEFYVEDLIGLEVVSPTGERLGKVVAFEDGGMQSWLVVETATGLPLVPFSEPLIRVDEDAGLIVLDAPEGLLDPDPSNSSR